MKKLCQLDEETKKRAKLLLMSQQQIKATKRAKQKGLRNHLGGSTSLKQNDFIKVTLPMR